MAILIRRGIIPPVSSQPTSGDSDVTAWIAAVYTGGGTVSQARADLITTLVSGLKSDSLWTRLDRLWVYAAENTVQAKIDLKNLVSHTTVSSPTFLANNYYVSDGATSYINTNFTPSTNGVNYTQNDASYGLYIVNNRTTDAGAVIPLGVFDGTTACQHVSLFFGGGLPNSSINGPGLADLNTGSSNSGGFYISTRSDNANMTLRGYQSTGDATRNVASVSSAVPTIPFFSLARNNSSVADSHAPDRLSLIFFGASMDSTQGSNFKTRVESYMDSLGIGLLP